MTVLSASSGEDIPRMLSDAEKMSGPVAVCYPSTGPEHAEGIPAYSGNPMDLVSYHGSDTAVIAVGHMAGYALEASKEAPCDVYVLRRVAPLPEAEIKAAAASHKHLIILEDGIKTGGIGERIHACLYGQTCEITVLAHSDGILMHATVREQMEMSGMSVRDIIKAIKAD